jgi:hypothetical protein
MDQSTLDGRTTLRLLVAAGLVWGAAEAALGLSLRGACGAGVTGAVMTGWAVLCLSAGCHASRRLWAPALLVGVAAGLKLIQAIWLGLPVAHGSVANPLFAFVVEAALMVAVVAAIRWARARGPAVEMAAGGLVGMAAAGLFPLAGGVTGFPACVHPGTNLPVSMVFAPLTAVLGTAAFPLGRKLAVHLRAWLGDGPSPDPVPARWLDAASAAALALFIGVEVLAR